MSSEKIELSAAKREAVGKQVKALRKTGQVPATIYEKGKESTNVQLEYLPLSKAWHKAGKHHAIELSVDGTKHLVMIKDVTNDPVKGTMSHVSFHAIKQNQAIEAEVPLHMVGDSPAARAGLLVRLNIDHVTVKGLPGNIPNSVDVDVSGVTTEDDDIRVADLTIPKDVELIDTLAETVVVSVTVPRAEVEKVAAEEEVDAANVPSDHGSEAAKTEE